MPLPTNTVEEVFSLIEARPVWPRDEWAFLSLGYMARLHFAEGQQVVDVYFGPKLVCTWSQTNAQDQQGQALH